MVCRENLQRASGHVDARALPPPLETPGLRLVPLSTVARELGVRLDECTFYTDDVGDLALLELVGEPVAVNPDPRLRREAGRRGWRVLDFAAPGQRADRAPSIFARG